MSGKISNWPSGWPKFTSKESNTHDTFELELKMEILKTYGAENIKKAWVKAVRNLEPVISEIAAKGNTVIPVLTYDQVIDATPETVATMQTSGCFVIRGVISTEEATSHFAELQKFVADNKESITGWPASNPAIFHLYYTPTQLKLRTDPRHLKLQKALNSLFHDSNPQIEPSSSDPILYADAVRMRAPGQEFLGLGPHIDAGSTCRWADKAYRSSYTSIFSGYPELYDPYDLGLRKFANLRLFNGSAHSSVFRAFQGWTALTGAAPTEGSLMLLPNIKEVTAYLILRPFFKMPADGSLEPEKWELDLESGWFPGTERDNSQMLSPESHPHLKLKETLVSIPAIRPGDTVWWHADVLYLR